MEDIVIEADYNEKEKKNILKRNAIAIGILIGLVIIISAFGYWVF